MAPALDIGVRLGLYLVLMAAFGAPLFALYALRGAGNGDVPSFRRLHVLLGIAGLLLSSTAILLLASSFAGVPVNRLDEPTLASVIRETSVGTAWQVRMGALLVFLFLAGLARPARSVWNLALSLAGGIALATLAWTGHGAMDEGRTGWIHLGTDIVHLLAAGVWIAALLLLALLLFRPAVRWERGHVQTSLAALTRFSSVGTVVVGLLVLTGLVNSWLLIGWDGLAAWRSSLYLQLLAAKLALFGLMLVLAALNRWRLVPALDEGIGCGDARIAVRALRRSLLAEGLAGGAILFLVAWLGTLAPPAAGA